MRWVSRSAVSRTISSSSTHFSVSVTACAGTLAAGPAGPSRLRATPRTRAADDSGRGGATGRARQARRPPGRTGPAERTAHAAQRAADACTRRPRGGGGYTGDSCGDGRTTNSGGEDLVEQGLGLVFVGVLGQGQLG